MINAFNGNLPPIHINRHGGGFHLPVNIHGGAVPKEPLVFKQPISPNAPVVIDLPNSPNAPLVLWNTNAPNTPVAGEGGYAKLINDYFGGINANGGYHHFKAVNHQPVWANMPDFKWDLPPVQAKSISHCRCC